MSQNGSIQPNKWSKLTDIELVDGYTTPENAHLNENTKTNEDDDGSTSKGEDVEKAEDATKTKAEDAQYPSLKLVLPSIISIYLAVFLCSLDRTIIGVAIPAITDDFGSFGDVAWYESSYFLSFCALQLPSGRLYTMFPAKWIFISLVAIFEIGSVVCAAAPSSAALIVGRTITGIGSSGIVSGATIIMVSLLPLHKRPKYQGFLGAVFGLASIIGPLVGGVFASKVTWRWCFWINLPIGGAALVILVLVLPLSPPAKKFDGTFLQKVLKLDPLGTMLLIPGLISLLFALQFGGSQYPWNDARVIALLVLGPVLLILFVVVEFTLVGDDGIISLRIIRQRSIAAGLFVSLGLGGTMVISTFYLPIWFQAIKGISAVDAGLRLLPYFLGTVVFVIFSGILVSKIGYYTPWLIVGTALMTVGSGLLTTYSITTSTAQNIGYQLILGAGMGMTLQQSNNAAQNVLQEKDIPIGVTVLAFAQIFSGSVFVTVCQAVVLNSLSSQLSSKIPGFDASAIATQGATNIRNSVPPSQVAIVLTAYNTALDKVFYVSVTLSCVAFVASLFMEWKKLKTTSR